MCYKFLILSYIYIQILKDIEVLHRGLFACISYHSKHLALISSETLSTCYFSAG